MYINLIRLLISILIQILFQIYFRKIIYENVELDLLKDPKFVSTLVGLGFAFVSDVTYLAMEPMLLFSYGFTKVEISITSYFDILLAEPANLD